MRQRARLFRIAPHPTDARSFHPDRQGGAGGGGDLHLLRLAQSQHRRPHLLFIRRGGGKALEHFRVLVGDVEHPRPVLEDGGQFGRVHQAFERAIGDKRRGGERLKRGSLAFEEQRRAC